MTLYIRLTLLLVASLLGVTTAYAGDTLEAARARGSILWGADQDGGAPYIFPSEVDQQTLIGFEVELAEAMSKELALKVAFQQSQWDALPSMLQARKVDIVMNGYEFMKDRAEAMDMTIPYYVYALQLEVRKDGPIQSWEQLKSPKPDGEKWRFGVLGGSAAEEYLAEFGGAIEVASYDGVTDAMREVETQKLDATLQDTPIASFYAKDFPNLRFVGDPVAPGYYVVYVRKGDRALVDALNNAFISLYRKGELERIYSGYGMWNTDQAELGAIIDSGKFYGVAAALADAPVAASATDGASAAVLAPDAAGASAAAAPVAVEKSRLANVADYARLLGYASGLTVLLSAISFPIAVALGLSVAIGRLYGPTWLKLPLTGYVEFLRGTPLMLQLYFIFYFLPEIGITISALPTAIIGLAVNYSAYESEIYRAGLQAIPGGQMEAALSLGMSRGQALQRIIVPQAFRIVIPPVVNDFIAMFKDTSVCSVVTIVELTKQFSVLSRNNVSDLVVLMGFTGLFYLLMSYPMSLIARMVEARLSNPVRP
ncbi:MAG: transporter substrate-binding domain-containing protein [Myxococcales bacterium]|nr:transporter substrate-binding domain-containing protein [Myxococcales bacterium]